MVHSGVGPISQSDVALAEATGARALVAFNVGRAPPTLAQQMGQAKLRLVSGRVIYHVVEEVGQILVDLAQGTAVTQVIIALYLRPSPPWAFRLLILAEIWSIFFSPNLNLTEPWLNPNS